MDRDPAGYSSMSAPLNRILETPAGQRALASAKAAIRERIAELMEMEREAEGDADDFSDGLLNFVRDAFDHQIADGVRRFETGAAHRGEFFDVIDLKNIFINAINARATDALAKETEAGYGWAA